MLRSRSNHWPGLLSAAIVIGLLLSAAGPGRAQAGQLDAGGLGEVIRASIARSSFADADMVSLLIKIDDAPLASYDGSLPGLAATSPQVTGVALDVEAPASQAYLAYLHGKLDRLVAQIQAAIPATRLIYRYDVVLGGVAVRLPRVLAGHLAGVAGVRDVLVDRAVQLDTYRSPAFIGAPVAWSQAGGQARAGEGVIVGVLDTGIWPENASFADPGPTGEPYAPPRPRGDGSAWPCDFSGGPNPGPPFSCNNKLISAQRFMDSYEAAVGLAPYEFSSARDDDGHGSHTSSIAAGNAGVPVHLLGNDLGAISGIAPRAQIVSYKICGELGCFNSDSLAAVQQAIVDGVDVINYSIEGGQSPYTDPVEQAFLQAYAAGIFVAASAGNNGPSPDSVAHRGPWTMTVAASTIDRAMRSSATLSADNGDMLTLVGETLTQGISTPAPVVMNRPDPFCESPAEPDSFAGAIVACRRGFNARVEKSANVAAGGAVGMFLYNPTAEGTNVDLHPIPSVHFEGGPGSPAEQLLAFLAGHTGVSATFTDGAPALAQGDVVAAFSSRGGNLQELGISKPDIAGPGVNTLAAYTGSVYGGPSPIYNIVGGTSMASPHLAGAGAILKWLHPGWSPGQIKSALMTTATATDLVKQDGVSPADAYDVGSGRVDLARAWNPGIAFDETAANFLALKNHLWDANYPSLFVPAMYGKITVQRTVTNLLDEDGEWRLSVEHPAGQPSDFTLSVPNKLKVREGRSASFRITVDGRDVPLGETRFATILFQDESGRSLRFPVTFVRKEAPVTITTTCSPASFNQQSSASCTIAIANTSPDDYAVQVNDQLPSALRLDRRSLVGGRAIGNRVIFSGTLHSGERHLISFSVEGRRPGPFVNYPKLTSDGFYGTSTARFAGEVTRR